MMPSKKSRCLEMADVISDVICPHNQVNDVQIGI